MITPKTLARLLVKNMRKSSMHLVNRVLAPNLYRVQMPSDFMDYWWALMGQLEYEMAEYLNEQIERSGYLELTAPVRVVITESHEPIRQRPLILSSFERPQRKPALLLPLAGMDPEHPLPLVKPVTILGRGEADIKLPEDKPFISRQHARIYGPDNNFVIQDMNSVSGTFVNQRPVKDAPLKAGDVIAIGDITWRFENEKGLDDVCIS